MLYVTIQAKKVTTNHLKPHLTTETGRNAVIDTNIKQHQSSLYRVIDLIPELYLAGESLHQNEAIDCVRDKQTGTSRHRHHMIATGRHTCHSIGSKD